MRARGCHAITAYGKTKDDQGNDTGEREWLPNKPPLLVWPGTRDGKLAGGQLQRSKRGPKDNGRYDMPGTKGAYNVGPDHHFGGPVILTESVTDAAAIDASVAALDEWGDVPPIGPVVAAFGHSKLAEAARRINSDYPGRGLVIVAQQDDKGDGLSSSLAAASEHPRCDVVACPAGTDVGKLWERHDINTWAELEAQLHTPGLADALHEPDVVTEPAPDRPATKKELQDARDDENEASGTRALRIPDNVHWQTAEAAERAAALLGSYIRLNTINDTIEWAEATERPDPLSPLWMARSDNWDNAIMANIQEHVKWCRWETAKQDGEERQRRRWLPVAYAAGSGPMGWRRWEAAAANKHRIDPRKWWLEQIAQNVTWDGHCRLDTYLDDMLAAADADKRMAGRGMWFHMAGTVLRLRRPGYKHDMALMLVGRRGAGKSTVMRVLLPPEVRDTWYVDLSDLDLSPARAREEMAGSLWVEVPEMVGGTKADTGRLKQFGSRTRYKNRAAYDRRTTDWLIDCMFFGTANSPQPLLWDEGLQRRWNVVAVHGRRMREADMDNWLDRRLPDGSTMREQIWAETLVRLATGEAPYPTQEEEELISARTDEAMLHGWIDEVADDLAVQIANKPDLWIPTTDARHAFGAEAERIKQHSPSEPLMASALRRAGLEPKKLCHKRGWTLAAGTPGDTSPPNGDTGTPSLKSFEGATQSTKMGDLGSSFENLSKLGVPSVPNVPKVTPPPPPPGAHGGR